MQRKTTKQRRAKSREVETESLALMDWSAGMEAVPVEKMERMAPETQHVRRKPVPNMGDAELRQPYMGIEVTDMKHPFPEAVLVQPVLAGRRRVGVFGSVDESNEAFYAPIEAFEGRHRYDPAFEWEPREEKRLVRKVSG